MCALSSPAVVVGPIPRFYITDDLWKRRSLYRSLAQARRDASFPRPRFDPQFDLPDRRNRVRVRLCRDAMQGIGRRAKTPKSRPGFVNFAGSKPRKQ